MSVNHSPQQGATLDLDAIRERLSRRRFITAVNQVQLRDDCATLLAEVDRLRSERDLYRDAIVKHRDELEEMGASIVADNRLYAALDFGGVA